MHMANKLICLDLVDRVKSYLPKYFGKNALSIEGMYTYGRGIGLESSFIM